MGTPEAIIEELRETCTAQADQIAVQASQIAKLQATVTFFEEQHSLALHRQFGRSSEQAPAGQEAFVFNEAETFADPFKSEPTLAEAVLSACEETPASDPASEQEPADAVSECRKTRTAGQRQKQVAKLDVQDIEHAAAPEEQSCPCCGEAMEFVDWQVREEVEYVPAKAVLVRHKQPIYACHPCQENGEPAPIKTIKTMPVPPFPKSLASASLVAHIIFQKFVMGAPLYRQEHNMEGLGVAFSRQTMCNWLLKAAQLFAPVYDRMHLLLLDRDVLHADETTVQVLREPGRPADRDSTMWLYRSGRGAAPIILFDYQTSNAGKHAKAFLAGFGGYNPETGVVEREKYLTTDGHGGYNCVPHSLLVDGQEVGDIHLSGCWSHARRKFHEAASIVKPGERKASKRIVADEGLKHCDDLFRLERDFKDMTDQERYAARLERSAPKLKTVKEWLDQASLDVLPKTATGVAVAYCLSQWDKLNTFLLDGRLEIDNNRAERSIRPFTVGRKNWMFANTPSGANCSAVLYSIVESAKENQLVPFQYIKHVLERLPNINTSDPTELDTLLPWATEIPQACRKE